MLPIFSRLFSFFYAFFYSFSKKKKQAQTEIEKPVFTPRNANAVLQEFQNRGFTIERNYNGSRIRLFKVVKNGPYSVILYSFVFDYDQPTARYLGRPYKGKLFYVIPDEDNQRYIKQDNFFLSPGKKQNAELQYIDYERY